MVYKLQFKIVITVNLKKISYIYQNYSNFRKRNFNYKRSPLTQTSLNFNFTQNSSSTIFLAILRPSPQFSLDRVLDEKNGLKYSLKHKLVSRHHYPL